MKKIVLSMMVAVAMLVTSCKTEKKESVKQDVKETTQEVKKEVKETTKEVAKEIESAIEGVKIPKFDNEKVTENLKSYAEYAKKYIDAKGDVLKNAKLIKEGKDLLEQGKELVKNLDEKAVKQYNKALRAIQAKMAPKK